MKNILSIAVLALSVFVNSAQASDASMEQDFFNVKYNHVCINATGDNDKAYETRTNPFKNRSQKNHKNFQMSSCFMVISNKGVETPFEIKSLLVNDNIFDFKRQDYKIKGTVKLQENAETGLVSGVLALTYLLDVETNDNVFFGTGHYTERLHDVKFDIFVK